jgi:hypothetical protein
MKALTRPRISRFLAGVLLAGALVVAGHHFVVVASADALAKNAPHHDILPHPAEEHGSPTSSIEAHSPTPIIQKFQLQKKLKFAAELLTFVSPIIDPPYRQAESVRHVTHIAPLSVPLALKTTFLN